MARNDTRGLRAALEAMAVSGKMAEVGCQEDFFEAPGELPLPARARSGPQGGRPQGATNKSTQEWSRFILSSGRSPLSVLQQLATHSLEELVDELQRIADKHARTRTTAEGVVELISARVDPLQVLRVQRDAAVALAEYVHKKQPKSIEVDRAARGVLILAEADDVEVAETDEVLFSAPRIENTRENSRLFDRSEKGNVGHVEKNNAVNGLSHCDD